MKNFRQRILKQKEQPNIYMQKTQGPKVSMSSPNINQRFKSNTLLNKENHQPNVPTRNSKPLIENSFGAARIIMRQSIDDLKPSLNKQLSKGASQKVFPQFSKLTEQKFNLVSRSINYKKCSTERNNYDFSKKHLKTEEDQEIQYTTPIIEDCQMTRSVYQSSQNSGQEETLNFSKSYQRSFSRQNNGRHILIHQSLNFVDDKGRQTVTFGPSEAKNLKRYQFSREEQKKMKNEIVNNIIMSSKAQMMKSCDFDSLGSLRCVNHNNKKAKYRLNNFLAECQEESFYCSKCAVNIAKQGIDIQEISALDRRMIMSRITQKDYLSESIQIKDQTSKREKDFISFQKRLQVLKDKISAKLSLFSEKSEEMSRLDKKIQLTICNYDQLIEILKEMRKQQMQRQNMDRKQKCLEISLKKHELSTILDNIKDTVFQINNEKNKMMALKNNDFNFMFDSYLNKISSYEEYLTNLQENQLATDTATFDSNLDSENFDEQTLIHAIFDQMYKKLTNPKLQALLTSSKSAKQNTQPIAETNMESGGSSMFFCCQDDTNQQPPHKAFRTLFENNKAEDIAFQQRGQYLNNSNPNNGMNVNSSADFQKSYHKVRYFKEENYMPSIQNNYQ